MRKAYFVTVGMLSLALSARTAFAQASGFALDRFEPSQPGSDWFTLESMDFRGHLRPAAGLIGEWGHKPLVVYGPDGTEKTSLVSDQFVLHAAGALIAWDRVRFGLDVPVALYQAGESANAAGTAFAAPDTTSLGDIRLGVDALAVGKYRAPVSFGGGVQVYLPTGSQDAFTGDGKVRIVPRLLAAGAIDKFEYAGKLGFAYRAQNDAFAGSPLGSELFLGAAAGIRPIDKLITGAEINLSTGVEDADAFFKRRTTPLELLFGAHYAVAPEWRIGGGVGPGLTRAFGTPQVRFVLSVEYVASYQEPAPPPPPPPPAPSDRDKDGIFDNEDACPDIPGVRTDDPKTNGCPPPPSDRDKDGIIDAEDACPDVPGVKTDDPKTNGCPPDRDKDSIIDAEDACPDVPGVKTDDPKTNGCPPDRDKDGIIDAEDACPDIPGERTNDPKTNGCPPARIEADEIKISKQVQFKFDSDVILPESDLILSAVVAILKEHVEISRVRIEGHTDDKGTDAYNLKLSQRRAASVVKWLVKHGVSKNRLTSQGFGQSRPIDRNDTDEGRAANRRVELHIEARKAEKKPAAPDKAEKKPAAPAAPKPPAL